MMKILSIQGHFGNMNGRRIDFTEGLCHSILPNGWGKSTLLAFIRVMLYGLNTSKRDTATALSDKTHFLPLDGQPMSGILRIMREDGIVVITRATGKGGMMQEFDAYYEDSGDKCLSLTAQNCGKELLGMGEDAFLSSSFVDGTDLQRPSDELRERMLSMAQSGDAQNRASKAIRAMERWRLNLDSGNGHGTLPRLSEARQQLEEKAAAAQMLEEQIVEQAARVETLVRESDTARGVYDLAYRTCSGSLVTEDERLNGLISQSTRAVRALSLCTPEESILRTAGEALCGYEGAVRLEREKREMLPQQGSRYDEALKTLDREQREDEIMRLETARPHIRWWALGAALVFAIAAIATLIWKIDWGNFTAAMPYILFGLTIASVLVAFVGSVRRCDAPPRDFNAARTELLRAQAREDAEQHMAASVLQDAYDTLMRAAYAIDSSLVTIEDATARIRQGQIDLQSLRHERAALEEFTKKRDGLHLNTAPVGREVETARETLNQKQKLLSTAQRDLAQLQGRAQALGSQDIVYAECDRLEAEQSEAEKQYSAICAALSAVKQEQAIIAARVSPRIADQTQTYMSYLTDGAYQQVQLDTALHARAAQEDGMLLDSLRLSVGTRDQLYLSLRLAVCKVMAGEGEPSPLMLDDPLNTFDDERTMRAMQLLGEIAQERQVILLTGRAI